MKPKVASKKKLPKYADGKVDPNALYGQIGYIASGAGQLAKTGNAHDFSTQAGTVLGAAGQGLEIGANPALMAATGGLSAPIGAVLGAGYGAFEAVGADAAQTKVENRQFAVNNMSINNSVSNGMNAQYNLRNKINDRVPGLADGVPSFKSAYAGIPGMNGYSNFGKGKNRYANGTPGFKSKYQNGVTPNAVVAPEEVIQHGQTGQLDQVPGNYNPSNPDTQEVNLADNSAVFTNKKSLAIPGGKSTDAQIMARGARVQKRADEIMNPKEGDIKLGRIDYLTAELNKRNVEMTASLFKKKMTLDQTRTQAPNQPALPGYADGGIYTSYYNKSNPSMLLSRDQVNGMSEQDRNNIMASVQQWSGSGESPYAAGLPKSTQFTPAGQLPTGSVDSNWSNTENTRNFTKPFGEYVSTYESPRAKAATPVVEQQAMVVPSQPDLSTVNNNVIGVGNSINRQASSVRAQNVQTSIDNQFNNNSSLDGLKSGSSDSYWNPGIPTGYGSTKMPQFTPNHSYNYTQGTTTNVVNTNNPNNVTGSSSYAGSGSLGSIATDLASMAPVAYNAWNATPEVVAPIYANYMNPNQRYNIAPELQEATKQRQVARYNSVAVGGGNGQSYAADMYGKGVDQLGGLYGKAETANAQYRNEYANRYNQSEGDNVNEQRRIYDVNARNRAAARNMQRTNAETISKYAQTKQLMSNQMDADLLNSNIFSNYNTAMDPKHKAILDDLLASYVKKNGYTKIGK